MASFGQTELVIALVVVFILFGHRLPSGMRYLGRWVVDSRYRAQSGDSYALWMKALDLLMIVIVFAALATLLMPR